VNTLILNKNIDFEQYQQIVDYFATIGIEITNPYEYPSLITNEDKQAIALAREDVEKGNWIEKKCFSEGKLVYIVEREITYY